MLTAVAEKKPDFLYTEISQMPRSHREVADYATGGMLTMEQISSISGKKMWQIREILEHPPVKLYCQENEAYLRAYATKNIQQVNSILRNALTELERRLEPEEARKLRPNELLAIARWVAEVHPQHQLTKVQQVEVSSNLRPHQSHGLSSLLKDAEKVEERARSEARKTVEIVEMVMDDTTDDEELTDDEAKRWDVD